MPLANAMYVVTGACSIVSGLLPGYFFRFIGPRVRPVSRALFHENNGFVVGLFVALVGATRFGAALVAAGPLVTASLVGLTLIAGTLKGVDPRGGVRRTDHALRFGGLPRRRAAIVTGRKNSIGSQSSARAIFTSVFTVTF